VTALAAQYGPTSGLDPEEPLDSLQFSDPVLQGDGRQVVHVDIVRSQQVETMILGFIPTASQETVLVEPAGSITVTLVDQPTQDWLPAPAQLNSSAWLIEDVQVGSP
jgi:hypothetical protein